MADLPILFSAPMVRAILRGFEQPGTGKTQTRRVISSARVFASPERPAWTLHGDGLAQALQNADRFRRMDGNGWFWEADAFEWQAPHTRTRWLAYIGYAPGDRLYVREAWKTHAGYDDISPAAMGGDEAILYQADGAHQTWGYPAITKIGRFRQGMHMPRWASRLTLIVNDVRVQRVQEISEADAIAEGIYELEPRDKDGMRHFGLPELGASFPTAVRGFRDLWDSLNAPRGYGWEANPWVAAYTFRPILGNIDQAQP